MLRVIINIVKAIFGGIAIIMVVIGSIACVIGIFTIPGTEENPIDLETAIPNLIAGSLMLLVGIPLFSVCSGARKKPLYFLAPFILIIAFILAGTLLPEVMWGVKGEGAALAALALTIVGFRFINRYYAKREQDNSTQEM